MMPTKMCFEGDQNGPDVWLTIENGRYVPAPPMVYIPGLRQIQDRLHHKTYQHIFPTCGNSTVRLPMDLSTLFSNPRSFVRVPPSSVANQSAGTTQPPLQDTHSASTSPTVPVPEADVAISESDVPSVEATRSSEALQQKPPEQPKCALPKVYQEKQPVSTLPANEDDPIPLDEVNPLPPNGILSSPFLSSASSLRSILKRPSTVASDNINSQGPVEASREKGRKDDMKQKQAQRPTTKKSVSFATDTAPPAASPNFYPAPETSAADEGAAIGRKLAERERESRSSKDFP